MGQGFMGDWVMRLNYRGKWGFCQPFPACIFGEQVLYCFYEMETYLLKNSGKVYSRSKI